MLKLGNAKAVITPKAWEQTTSKGMPRLIPNQGVLDNLQADVFVLQDGKMTVVIGTVDQVFVEDEDFANMEAKMRQRLPEAKLLLCATHDHSATSIAFKGNAIGEANSAAARETMYSGFASALDEALKGMREVEVAARQIRTEVKLGYNRRGKLGNGSSTTAWGAGPLIPPGHKCVGKSGGDADWIDVIAFRAPGAAEPCAVLSSYASHVHLYEVPYFTGEVAGAARTAMTGRHPSIQLMYSVGIAGDVALQFAHPNPSDDEPGRIAWQKEKAAAFGEAFSRMVSDELASLQYAPVDAMQYEAVHEPVEKKGMCFLVQTLRLGPHAICCVPGEMLIAWDAHLRSGMPCETLLPMAYNCSNLEYIATPLTIEEGSYETKSGPLTKITHGSERPKSSADTGQRVVDTVRGQLTALFGR